MFKRVSFLLLFSITFSSFSMDEIPEQNLPLFFEGREDSDGLVYLDNLHGNELLNGWQDGGSNVKEICVRDTSGNIIVRGAQPCGSDVDLSDYSLNLEEFSDNSMSIYSESSDDEFFVPDSESFSSSDGFNDVPILNLNFEEDSDSDLEYMSNGRRTYLNHGRSFSSYLKCFVVIVVCCGGTLTLYSAYKDIQKYYEELDEEEEYFHKKRAFIKTLFGIGLIGCGVYLCS